VSKNSFLPSSTLSGVTGLSAGTAISPSGPTFAAGAGAGVAAGCVAGFSELLPHEATDTTRTSRTIADFMMLFLFVGELLVR
jgi:hypothetical protein